MDYLQAFVISAAGMTVERTRVDVAAVNLANAGTVQDVQGDVYRPLRAVIRNDDGNAGFSGLVETAAGTALPAVTVEAADVAPRIVYEPGHPFANTKGFVTYPGVDTAVEMVTMMHATRAYEANVAAMSAARMMALKALDIGGPA